VTGRSWYLLGALAGISFCAVFLNAECAPVPAGMVPCLESSCPSDYVARPAHPPCDCTFGDSHE
jgi:hypothetical protein